MANSPQDHVHRLIRSMTRPEKRYFKVYTSRHLLGGQSNHHRLFDAIAAMEEYDEELLHRKFAGQAFMHRFSITKRRLYEAILQSLDAFHAESSVDARLRRSLHQVELLYERALYADAEKMLRSVRALAREHDKQPALLEVAEWQRKVMERSNYSGVGMAELEELARTTAGIQAEWNETDALWHLKSRCFLLLYRNGQVRDDTALEEVKALLGHPLLAEGAVLRTAKARFLHHHVRSALAFALNDLPECERHLAASAALLEQEQAHFKDEPNLLLGVMSNQVTVRMRLGRYTEAMEGLREFRRLPLMMPEAPSPDLGMKLFIMGSSLELMVLCRMGDFGKALEKLPALEEGMALYGERLSVIRRAGLWFQAAYACFGAGQADKALRWCHRLLNENGIDEHAEVHAMGRMLNLMVLVELNKRDLLPYALRNTERFLRSRDRTFRFESALLAYVHEHLRALRPAEQGQARARLRDELELLAKDPFEATVFDHFDPLAWAESKVSGLPFAEVVRARAAEAAARTKGAKAQRAA